MCKDMCLSGRQVPIRHSSAHNLTNWKTQPRETLCKRKADGPKGAGVLLESPVGDDPEDVGERRLCCVLAVCVCVCVCVRKNNIQEGSPHGSRAPSGRLRRVCVYVCGAQVRERVHVQAILPEGGGGGCARPPPPQETLSC